MISKMLDFKSNEAREMAIKMVEENFDDISRRLTSMGLEDRNMIGETPKAFEVLVKALNKIGPLDESVDKYFDAIKPVTGKVLQVIQSQNTDMAGNFAVFLLNLRLRQVDRGSQELNETENLMKRLLFDQELSLQAKRNFFENLQKDHQPNIVHGLLEKELIEIIADEDLPRKIADSLLSEDSNDLRFDEVYKTLKVCNEIEEAEKGACKRINKLFGITHFGRYRSDFLSGQLLDWDNGDNTNYGVMLNPYGDWNSAFYESGEDITKVSEQVFNGVKKFGFKTRVIEAKNKEEFIMRQLELREHFNDAGNFYFLVIGAHGSAGSFTLGKGSEGRIGILDVPLMKKDLSKLYQPYMQTLFFSCSTGVKNGIAENWSDTRIESIGPDYPGSVKDVEVFQRPGGLLGFAVRFNDNEGVIVNQKRYPRFYKI